MLKRNNKKGFTLAELLIVVAIIAVLVAIAVPLFVGSLADAKDATYKANAAAVKHAGIIAILTSDTLDADTLFASGNKVYASAIVDDEGAMTDLTIKWEAAATENIKPTTNYDDWMGKEKGIEHEIIVKLERTDLTSVQADEVEASSSSSGGGGGG